MLVGIIGKGPQVSNIIAVHQSVFPVIQFLSIRSKCSPSLYAFVTFSLGADSSLTRCLLHSVEPSRMVSSHEAALNGISRTVISEASSESRGTSFAPEVKNLQAKSLQMIHT